MDRRCASSALNAEVARPRGLTSGSACRLTSRSAGHVAAIGLRLSREQRRMRYGPDTCRPRAPAWPWLRSGYPSSQSPGTLLWVARTPHRGVRDPYQGFGSRPWRYWTFPRGPVRIHRGPVLPMGVRTYCWYLGGYHFLWPRGGPGAGHMVGSGAAHHATRDSRVGTASSWCSRGYPCFRVPTEFKFKHNS
jgi:hypothetical protein